MAVKFPYEGMGFQNRSGDLEKYGAGFLLTLYESMSRIRVVEEEIAREYHKDEIKNPVHLVIGQEATAVGLCSVMLKTDLLYLTHRTHGGYLAKGGNLNSMMSELYCKANGCVGSRGGSMHLIDKEAGVAGTSAIVGGIIPIATGAALAIQMRAEKNISAVLMGDAATEEGVTSESINFAVLKKLPIVFFCENNFYSVQSPLDSRQPITRLATRAAGFGIATETCDGSNVLDVFETVKKAVTRARDGEGPTFIEAPVYRQLAHAGASDDSHTGYRTGEERAAWINSADPIITYKNYLTTLGIPADQFSTIDKNIEREVQTAFTHAKSSPVPNKEEFKKYVYALG
jgi:acetoin:2,6-dichlorophenolindophenol oxidoreductase subunit alpha